MIKSALDPEWGTRKHTSPFRMAPSNVLGHRISVTANNAIHYLSRAILWDSRNPPPAGGTGPFLEPLKPPRLSCCPTPKMFMAPILYFPSA